MTHRILHAGGIYALTQSKELISKNSKHTILQTIYGPVDSDIKAFNTSETFIFQLFEVQ